MASSDFSRAVLAGMKLCGCSERQIEEITGLSKATLKSVLSRKRRLTDQHLARIEEATGRTVGQLAALTLPAEARPLTYIFDELAQFRIPSKKAAARKRA